MATPRTLPRTIFLSVSREEKEKRAARGVGVVYVAIGASFRPPTGVATATPGRMGGI